MEAEQFLALLVPKSDCLEWPRSTTWSGHGHLRVRGRLLLAHRFAWALKHGEAGDQKVLHKCDNPPCCNTEHLYLGTIAQNNRDARERGQAVPPPSQCKLTMDQVGEIRDRHATGELGKILAFEYGISASCVSAIVNWKTYLG